MSAADDREYTANTLDETVWVRVSGSGRALGVQIEPEVMGLPGSEIAARIQACADVAYFQGRVELRTEWEQGGAAAEATSWMATQQDLQQAENRLRSFRPHEG